MGFYTWMITKYEKKNSPRGDLARDMRRDEDIQKLCQEHSDRDTILWYLHLHGACAGCVKVFERCFRDYRKRSGENAE